MKNFLFILALFAFLLACEKGDEQVSVIKGTWVESENRSDTLIFGELDLRDGQLWFELKRPELIGTGPYNYYFFHDSISIQSAFSSCLCRENYYFSLEKGAESFRIGNFIDPGNSHTGMLVFEKVIP